MRPTRLLGCLLLTGGLFLLLRGEFGFARIAGSALCLLFGAALCAPRSRRRPMPGTRKLAQELRARKAVA